MGFARVVGAALMAASLAGCGSFLPRFSDDVQRAFAHDDMRRIETDRFIVYYAAHRRAEIDRFLIRAGSCADQLRAASLIHDGPARDKMVIVMPDVPYNNAFVLPDLAGYEHVSMIPTVATLDFTTEFGLVPDPGYLACHELTHYVHLEQVTGLWKYLDDVLGHVYSPQSTFEFWFLEGLATHYEGKLLPGMGRPTWPIFTGMFAAGYAGQAMSGGDLSDLGRLAPVGHHYLVGTMLVRFLTEQFGEPAVWKTIASQAGAVTGLFTPLAFKAGFGASLGDLLDRFDAWHARTFPVRLRPAGQRALVELGNDARYARGRDGTEAWVSGDVDAPVTLTVRDPDGRDLASIGLIDIMPPRTLVEADPLAISGLSVTADGREVWLTAIDRATTREVTRLLRWRRGETKLTEVASELGPGATIDPRGTIYYHCVADGDRWSLAAFDLRTRQRKLLLDMAPGTYALAAQVSRDGAQLAVNVWDGHAFVIWVIDAATGQRLRELRGAPGQAVWDASFTDDGQAMYLGVVDTRFQVFIEGTPVSDAPYTVLNARAARGTIRLLNREGWRWTVDELALPAAGAPPAELPPEAGAPVADAPPLAPGRSSIVTSDEPFHAWDRLFVPTLHAPIILQIASGVPHVGVQLGGGDRLDLQRWLIAGYGQYDKSLSDRVHWGADAEYQNHMLAPWTILATAGFVDWVDSVRVGGTDETNEHDERRTRDVTLSISRIWRDSLATALTGVYTDDYDGLLDRPRRHLGGPVMSLDWLSAETTPYTGIRRALIARAAVGYYPHALSTFAGDIYDTGGELGAVMPLPFGARHTLTLTVRGRAILARDDSHLLQLGGDAGIATIWDHSSNASAPSYDDTPFPPNLRFIEVLRGYEDYGIATDRAAIANLSWRYPLIIDRGTATTLWFLPSSFLSELDLELFGAGAIDRSVNLHAAVGAELTARFTVARIPLSLAYQIARRVRDDDALTQMLGIALPLPY